MLAQIAAADRVDVRTWLANVQYREIHAFIWGFGLAAGSILGAVVSTAVANALATTALLLLLSAFTGRRALAADLSKELDTGGRWGSLVEFAVGAPSDSVLERLAREPHYYVGGLLAGGVLGTTALVVTSEVLR